MPPPAGTYPAAEERGLRMAEFDHGIKRITDTSARELARVAGLTCGRLSPLEGTLPTTIELLADRAFRASHGRERFVVYFEFYTR